MPVQERDRGEGVSPDRRQARKRAPQSRNIFVGAALVLAAVLVFAGALYLVRKLGGEEAHSSANVSTTQVLFYSVDAGLSGQAQAGSLGAGQLPPGKQLYDQLERDGTGNLQRNYYGQILSIPWVVDARPLLDPGQVTAVSNPGSDTAGNPLMVIRLTADGATQLQQAAAPGKEMAIVTGIEVRAVVALGASGDGQVVFNCSPREAQEITGLFQGAAS